MKSHILYRLSEYAIAVVVFALLLSAPVFAQVTDHSLYIPKDYARFEPPPAGEIYTDERFKTSINRVSDATRIRDVAAGSGHVPFVAVEYSTMSPFNQDNSRLLLQHGSYFGLYDGSRKFLKNLPFEVNSSSEPRWSRTAANILYYHAGNQLKQLDVSSNRASVIHTFTEYSRIDGAGESDICFDGNHLVLAGDKRFIFVFDLKTGKKGGVLDSGMQPFDSLYITPDDHVTVTWLASGAHAGIELFDNDMKFLRRVAPVGGHMDVTRDSDGEEILLWANAADPKPVCDNGIVKIRLSDAHQTCLIKFDWTLATHVSATDNSGWFFVETYNPRDVDTATGWKPFTNEILQVKLDGSEVRRIAHHRSRPFDSYNYTPRVSSSRDGSRVVFASNFGLPAPADLQTVPQELALAVEGESVPRARSLREAVAGYRNPLYSDVYYIEVDPHTAGTAISGKISAESATFVKD
jgi:hypothetical protein